MGNSAKKRRKHFCAANLLDVDFGLEAPAPVVCGVEWLLLGVLPPLESLVLTAITGGACRRVTLVIHHTIQAHLPSINTPYDSGAPANNKCMLI